MNETYIYGKIMEHEEQIKLINRRMDSLVTRDEFDVKMDKVFTALDRLSNEQLIANHRLEGLEMRMDSLGSDMSKIKKHLGVVESGLSNLESDIGQIKAHLGIAN